MNQQNRIHNLISKPETKGFIKFYDELLKSEDQFCLIVDFKKSPISRVINIKSENWNECELIPSIDIIHVQGMIRFTPIYLEGYENSVCLTDFWSYYEGDNYLICHALFQDTLEIINKANLNWDVLPHIREKLKL